jgi:dipeptidyl aminopeptidase/acylaminoacyl peptidase
MGSAMDQHIDLLPRRLIFGNPERSIVRISHDGTRIAFLAPVDGVLNLWVGPIERIEDARPVTKVADRNLGPWIVWMHDNRHVLFFRDKAGDENWCAWAIDLESGDLRALTPQTGVTCGVQQLSREFPSELLIKYNERDKRHFDLYRVNVATGDSTVIETNEAGFTGYFTDQRFRVLFAARVAEDGWVEYSRRGNDGRWDCVERINADDHFTTQMVEVSADGRELYWLDSRGRNTAAVIAQDLASGGFRVLAEDPHADFTGILLDPALDRPIAAVCARERQRWQVLDATFADDFATLTRLNPGDLAITGMSQDRQHWLIAYYRDDAPLQYFHYDRGRRQARRLFSSAPALEGLPLVKMEPVTIRARDGLELICYLSRPHRAAPSDRLAMVLLVHGGPWSRDVWGLSPNHQWLANRGYAVLSVNFRGSTGFGKAFVNAGNREWAGKMHDDLIDAVDWAVEQGIADPVRIAIMGTSYGGYSALVGVTFTPEKFACAVDLVGISNLVTFMNTIPDYWQTWKSILAVRVGDYKSAEGRKFLEERSPLNRADRIVRPLLIGQGANDVRVKAAEAEQIVAAMERHGIPVTYIYYPDEGHGLGRPENRQSFAAITEAFLARHLGGRRQPIGDDFDGSTITFRAGRDLIPSDD